MSRYKRPDTRDLIPTKEESMIVDGRVDNAEFEIWGVGTTPQLALIPADWPDAAKKVITQGLRLQQTVQAHDDGRVDLPGDGWWPVAGIHEFDPPAHWAYSKELAESRAMLR